MRVVAVERMTCFVWAATYAIVVVGAEATNGGLWCWPKATTSRPTSSASFATSTWAVIRSCSVGVRPVVGSVVTSPTVKMPNCMMGTLPCGCCAAVGGYYDNHSN